LIDFDQANECASMHSLVKIHNNGHITTAIFYSQIIFIQEKGDGIAHAVVNDWLLIQ
jgi:hypothetical protein